MDKFKGLKYMVLGSEVALTVAGSAWLGWWLDTIFGTGPWLLLVLSILGTFSSVAMLLKLASRLSKEDEKEG